MTARRAGVDISSQFGPPSANQQISYVPSEPLADGTHSVVVSVADRYNQQSLEVSRTVTVDTVPPLLVTISPQNEARIVVPNIQLEGRLNEPSLVLLGSSSQQGRGFSFPLVLQPGTNSPTLTATDAAGNNATFSLQYHYLTVTIVSPGEGATVSASSVEISGSFTGPPDTVVAVNSVPAVVSGQTFTATVALAEGVNTLRVDVTSAGVTASRSIAITRQQGAVPVLAAPAIDLSVPTSLFKSTEFLYTGPSAVQTGVQPGTIKADRAAVIRGRVTDSAGIPVSGVTVSVRANAQYGQTVSRTDGYYDLATNGGEPLVVNFSKSGYLPVHRPAQPAWQQYAVLDDVVLTPLDTAVSTIALSGAQSIQVARGNPVGDTDGIRRATVMFPAGVTATMVLGNGSTSTLSTINVRATEFTIGANGPKAMPGTLPPSSGYTYALELSVDEAVAAGADEVRFSQPVSFYVENFLHFPVGGTVPVGYYDRKLATWVAAPNGRVIKIVAIVDGRAQVDTNGDGQADNAGISDAEAQALATLYVAGTELWWVLVDHFTPWDCNWPYGPPPGARPAPGPRPDEPPLCETTVKGSVVSCESQVLGEELPVTGAPFSLTYRSDRVTGNYTIDIPLSGATMPVDVRRIDVVVTIAGQVLRQSYVPMPNAKHVLTWNGLDAYGRRVNGAQAATVRIAFVYKAQYYRPADLPAAFAAAGTDVLSGNAAREEVSLWLEYRVVLGAVANNRAMVGGWQPSIVHAADPVSGIVQMGDGSRLVAGAAPQSPVAWTIAGTGSTGFNGDGIAGTLANLSRPEFVSVDGSGNVYVFERDTYRVRKISPEGLISTALQLSNLVSAHVVDKLGTHIVGFKPEGPNAPYPRIFSISPSGTEKLLAGAAGPAQPDDGPALKSRLKGNVTALAVGPDGEIYFVEDVRLSECNGFSFVASRVRRLRADGTITTVLGPQCQTTGPTRYQLEWSDLLYAALFPTKPYSRGGDLYDVGFGRIDAIDIDPKGNLVLGHLDSQGVHYVSMLGPDGIIRKLAGGYRFKIDSRAGDGMPLDGIGSRTVLRGSQVAVDPLGETLVAEGYATLYEWRAENGGFYLLPGQPGSGTVRAIDGETIRTIAGGGTGHVNGASARQVYLSGTEPDAYGCWQWQRNCWDDPIHLRIATHPAGGFIVSDAIERRIFRFAPLALLDAAAAEIKVPSRNGSEFFVFSGGGRHLRTLNAYTGATIYSFGYDPQGGLTTITAAGNNVTAIKTTLPSGLAATAARTANVTLTDPSDAMSLVQETITQVVNGRSTTSTYTAIDRQVVTTMPSGRTAVLRTDAVGRPTYSAIVGLEPVSYAYDGRGRLQSVAQGTGNDQRLLSYSYGTDGFVESVTDALTQTLLYRRDPAGRVIQASMAGSRTIGFGYDANGNMTRLTPPGKPDHTISYNNLDLETGYAPPVLSGVASPEDSVVYNRDEQPTLWSLADGRQLALGYDAASGLLRSLTPSAGAGNAITLTYDATSGQLQSLTTPQLSSAYTYDGPLLATEITSGAFSATLGWTYDTDWRVAALSLNGSSLSFAYDGDGLLTRAGDLTISRHAQHGMPTATSLGALATTQAYTQFGEPSVYSASYGGSQLYSLSLTYDNLGRVSRKTEAVLGVSTERSYEYDEANRLQTVKAGGTTIATYGYDANDNRTTVNDVITAVVDAQDRLIVHGAQTFVYTAIGNLQQRRIGDQTTSYDYDIYGNLTAVTLPGAGEVSYVVDAAGRRVGKKVNGTLTRSFVYQDALRIAAELDGNGVVRSRFIYGERPNVPEYMIRAGITYRLITDHLGSVRLVVSTSTGQIEQRIDYDEWGRVLSDSNPGFQPFGFAGGLYDPDTALVRFGARDYDASTGRWTSKDPIRFNGGNNTYAYVGGNPISNVDPMGLSFASAVSDATGGCSNNSFADDVVNNFVDVQDQTSLAKTGMSLALGGAFAKQYGGLTVLGAAADMLRDSRAGFAITGVGSRTFLQAAATGAATWLVNGVLIKGSFDAGALAGSVLRTAINRAASAAACTCKK